MRQAVYFAQSNSDFSILTILQDVRESFCGAYDAAGITVTVQSDRLHDKAGILTAPQTAYALRRILQEVFTNILRHSKATTVDVHVQILSNNLHISIQDNGIGYGLQENVIQGNGLESIRRRAQSIGAVLAVDSHTLAGTCITLSLDCCNAPAIGG
jgi:signal transduction histidine kinase